MSAEVLITIIAAGLAALGLMTFVVRKPKHLDKNQFKVKWDELQRLCGNQDTWPLAVINADKLMDEALRKRHFKGKTMGERLVSAQRSLTDNDGVWYGHKLRNRLVHEDTVRLQEKDVKQALMGFRQGLRDLGGL